MHFVFIAIMVILLVCFRELIAYCVWRLIVKCGKAICYVVAGAPMVAGVLYLHNLNQTELATVVFGLPILAAILLGLFLRLRDSIAGY